MLLVSSRGIVLHKLQLRLQYSGAEKANFIAGDWLDCFHPDITLFGKYGVENNRLFKKNKKKIIKNLRIFSDTKREHTIIIINTDAGGGLVSSFSGEFSLLFVC